MQIQQVTVGQVLEWGKNLSIAISFLTFTIAFVWKARGVWDKIFILIDRFTKHMDLMESGMDTLLNNHLQHLPQDIANAIKSEKSQEYVEIPENHGSR